MAAMKQAVAEAALFGFIVSPDTPEECFSFFEATCAEYEKARRPGLELLAWPIKGATFRNCPEWMQRYFAIPPSYSLSDMAREIRSRVSQARKAQAPTTLKYMRVGKIVSEK